jgi:hypothetical protein
VGTTLLRCLSPTLMLVVGWTGGSAWTSVVRVHHHGATAKWKRTDPWLLHRVVESQETPAEQPQTPARAAARRGAG